MEDSGSKGFGSVERGGSGRASAGKDHNGETNPDRPQVTFWDFSVERDEEAAANAAADGDADTIPPQVMFIHQVLPRIALQPPPLPAVCVLCTAAWSRTLCQIFCFRQEGPQGTGFCFFPR